MNWFLKLLKGFEFNSLGDFLQSMMPSCKYGLTLCWVSISGISTVIGNLLGLDALAFLAFVVVMGIELISGLYASHIKNEEFQSHRFSRFLFKFFYYIAIIAVVYLMAESFRSRGKDLAAGIFEWLHIFLVVQVSVENILSVLENAAVIEGKDKTHYITRIKEFLASKL